MSGLPPPANRRHSQTWRYEEQLDRVMTDESALRCKTTCSIEGCERQCTRPINHAPGFWNTLHKCIEHAAVFTDISSDADLQRYPKGFQRQYHPYPIDKDVITQNMVFPALPQETRPKFTAALDIEKAIWDVKDRSEIYEAHAAEWLGPHDSDHFLEEIIADSPNDDNKFKPFSIEIEPNDTYKATFDNQVCVHSKIYSTYQRQFVLPF